MDFDQIQQIEDFGSGAKKPFFDSYIKPLLNPSVEINHEELAYFYDAGFNAWKLSITDKQIKNAQLVSALLGELAQQDEVILIEIVKGMLAEQRSVLMRAETDERNAYNARLSKNIERIFNDVLEQYKGMFENQFRYWATIPYAYIVKVHRKGTEPASPADFLHVAGGTKFSILSTHNLSHTKGDLKDFVIGFDNEIRNAGGGHDGYEITDKETVILHVRDPHTGAYKGTGQIELSEEELQELIGECRRTIWSLETGFAIFMHNNPQFAVKCVLNREEKIRDIKVYMAEYAKNLSLTLPEFEISEDRKIVSLAIEYKPAVLGEGGQLLMPDLAYDLIKRDHEVSYKEQLLGFIQYLLVRFFPSDKIPDITAKVHNEKHEKLAELTLEPSELVRLYEGKAGGIPQPSKGQYPEGTCRLLWETPVPRGMGNLFQEILRRMDQIKSE